MHFCHRSLHFLAKLEKQNNRYILFTTDSTETSDNAHTQPPPPYHSPSGSLAAVYSVSGSVTLTMPRDEMLPPKYEDIASGGVPDYCTTDPYQPPSYQSVEPVSTEH